MKRDFVIGSLYAPDRRPHHDRDAVRLQSALLGNRPSTDWDGLVIVATIAAAIAAWVMLS